MDTTKEVLNQVLVKIFNQILFNEEDFLRSNLGDKVTLRGVHILESIASPENGEPNTKNVAATLGVTAGTLSVGLKKLISDGYVQKTQSTTDKRIYFLSLTPAGKKVCDVHNQYHAELIDKITRNLSAKEAAALVDMLGKIKYLVS